MTHSFSKGVVPEDGCFCGRLLSDMHNDNNWKGLPLSVCVGVCVGRGGGGESIDGCMEYVCSWQLYNTFIHVCVYTWCMCVCRVVGRRFVSMLCATPPPPHTHTHLDRNLHFSSTNCEVCPEKKSKLLLSYHLCMREREREREREGG